VTEWLDRFLFQVVEAIAAWGYWGVGIGMAIESANIPLPSEIILPFGGFLVSQGLLTFWGVVLAGTVGGTAGSVFSYLIGSWGGRLLVERYGPYFGVSREKLAWADRWFATYGEATVFFTRLVPVIRTFISLPAGISRMHLGRFVVYSFLGSLLWSIALTYVGLLLGENWHQIKPWFHRLDAVIVALLVCAGLSWWWHSRRRPK
jgi:membrane protein DedA with SNARE-associated domain